MNPNVDLLHTLSYGLVTNQFLLPAKTAEKEPILTDTQDILERATSKHLFVVKILNGDLLGPEVFLFDYNSISQTIEQRKTAKQQPLLVSYFIVASGQQVEAYRQALSAMAQKPEISITLLNTDSGETDTFSCEYHVQKQAQKQVLADFKRFFNKELPTYTVSHILAYIQNIAASASKVGAISGISATKILIGVLIFIFLAGALVKTITGFDFFLYVGCQHNPSIVINHEYWRLFTPILLHFDIFHLASNAYFLYVCGEMIERIYGKGKFLLIYFITGLCGNLLSLFLMDPNAISVGASGACMGLGGILVYLWMRKKNNFLRYFQNMTSFIVMIFFNVFYGFFAEGINNWAHLGGFVAGILLGLLLEALQKSKIFFPKQH